MASWRKKMLAAVVTIALAAGMCPGFAQAGELTASASLETQATKTVYVLTGLTETYRSTSKDGYTGELRKFEQVKTVKFTYAKNGLLVQSAYSSGDLKNIKHKWKYNKKYQIVKIIRNNGTTKITLNSKGRMKKAKIDYGWAAYSDAFTYKSGKVAAIKTVGNGTTEEKKFAYKNGRVVSMKSRTKGSGIPSSLADWRTTKYSYDKKGNLAGMDATYSSKGLLTKRYKSTYKDSSPTGSETTITYKYKAIKVNSKLASQIKEQQWALLNDNINFALGNNFGYGYFNATNNFAN